MTDDADPPRYGFGSRGPRPGWTPGNRGQTYKPTHLLPEDVEALLIASGGGGAGLRGRAAIGLLYRTGMTPKELMTRDVRDVRLTEGDERIWVGGTHLADRWLALDAPALTLLRPWLDLRGQWSGDTLFCVTDGPARGAKPWNEDGLRQWLDGAAQRAGLDLPGAAHGKRVHPGAFRFSLAADLMAEQWPIPYIQSVLGTQTFQSFQKVMEHLGLRPPPAEDVVPLIRNHRPAWEPPPVTPVPRP